jgi:hypothetical protein
MTVFVSQPALGVAKQSLFCSAPFKISIQQEKWLMMPVFREDQDLSSRIAGRFGPRRFFSKLFEGQGRIANMVEFHTPFFSSETAQDLLVSLEKDLPQSQSVALTAEVPLSPSLVRVFNSAKALRRLFCQNGRQEMQGFYLQPKRQIVARLWNHARKSAADAEGPRRELTGTNNCREISSSSDLTVCPGW